MKPDARKAAPLTRDATAFLVREAIAAVGTRTKLAQVMGVNRRDIYRREHEGVPFRDYAERFLVERIIATWRPT